MAETKTKAFRADEETINRINAWAEQEGLRNADVLPALLNLVELADERKGLAGRSDEIDNFQNLLRQIETAYIASLNLAGNAEERIRSEFADEMASHTQTVIDLQEQVRKEKEAAAAATEERDKALARADADTARTEQAEKRVKELEQSLTNKEKLNAVLSEKASELKEKIAILDADLAEAKQSKKRAEQAERRAEDLRKELERQAEQSKTATEAAYEKGKSDGKQEGWSYFKEQLDAMTAERKELIDKLTK